MVTLPIYHSNAGVIGVGSAIVSGGTVILRKKFSATNFWTDAIKYRCTVFSYVGEVCRYLLNQPRSDLDQQHSIRVKTTLMNYLFIGFVDKLKIIVG